MTTEQILEKIKQQRGETALGDGIQLMGMFADYSRGQLKPQQNQLRIFLECRGNTRILSLRDVPKQKQQVEWNRLLQEMVNDYGMQKEVAAQISGAFWRVAIGTEPPVSVDESVLDSLRDGQKSAEKMRYADPCEKNGGQTVRQPSGTSWHENAPMRDNAGDIDADKAAEAVAGAEKNTVYERQATPAGEKSKEAAAPKAKKQLKFFTHFSSRDRSDCVAFWIGLVSAGFFSPLFVSACFGIMKQNQVSFGSVVFDLLFGIVPFLLTIWRLYLLWTRGFGSLFSDGILKKWDYGYSKIAAALDMIFFLFGLLMLGVTFAEGLGVQTAIESIGCAVFAVFHSIWHWEKSRN